MSQNPRRRRDALLLLLLSIAVTAAPEIARNPIAVAKGGPLAIYVSNGAAVPEFKPLNPMTLEDGGTPLTIELSGEYPAWTISADGSTIATIVYMAADLPLVRVFDAGSTAIRTSFSLPVNAGNPMLNADGSRLIVQLPQSGGVTGVTPPA